MRALHSLHCASESDKQPCRCASCRQERVAPTCTAFTNCFRAEQTRPGERGTTATASKWLRVPTGRSGTIARTPTTRGKRPGRKGRGHRKPGAAGLGMQSAAATTTQPSPHKYKSSSPLAAKVPSSLPSYLIPLDLSPSLHALTRSSTTPLVPQPPHDNPILHDS